MALSDVSARFNGLLVTVGKQVLNTLFPQDFEYYLVAFELVDSKDRTVDYLTFPVLPDVIAEGKTELTTIKKSAGGITSIGTSTFVPRDINIKGTFGRQFKFLLGVNEFNFAGLRFSTLNGIFKKEDMGKKTGLLKNPSFSAQIKTGYGCSKVLESIIDKATGIDDANRPMRLYFYNLTLGNNYLVEPRSLQFSQDKSSNNMFWNYDLVMTAVAPVGNLRSFSPTSLVKLFGTDLINKDINNLRSSIKVSF